MFVSLAFATPSALGWDETVKGLIIDRVRHYEFKVDEKTYVTEKCIAEYASETIIGRGTRIYLVVDKETKAKCVLKDYWIDDNRKREGEIVAEMLEAVRQTYDCETSTGSIAEDIGEAEPSGTAVEIVKSHLLTIEKEALMKVGNETDHTKNVIFRGSMPTVQEMTDLRIKKTQKGYYKSVGPISKHDNVARTPASASAIRSQYHCRVVYAEYATPISEVETVLETVTTLDDTTKGKFFSPA